MLRRQGWMALGLRRRIQTIEQRGFGSRAEQEDPAIVERRRRMREAARVRYEQQQREKRGEVERKYTRGEVDGRKYVDWGKDKYKLPLRDGSGLLLGKATKEKIENARLARKKAEELEKKRLDSKKKTKSGSEQESSKKPASSKAREETSVKMKEKVSSIDTEDDEDDDEEEEGADDEEEEGEAKKKKKKKKGKKNVPAAKPKSKGTELLDAAIKSLKSLQSEVDGAVDLPVAPAKVEGWKTSYRDRAEKALVDKGLVPQEECQNDESAAAAEEEIPESTAILHSFMESNELEGSEEEDEFDEEIKADEEDDDDQSAANLEREAMIEEFNKAANSSGSANVSGAVQARALLAAIDDRSAEIGPVLPEEQRSVRVGIIGAPNAGKSSLLNFMVGTKVSAVSRKTNTTRNEILGILTENDTQILFYDTPGLMMRWKGQPIKRDSKSRVKSAWMVTGHCEVLIVLVDAHRQIERPDERVRKLVEKLGEKKDPKQKRVLCLNKVDLIRQKRELVPLAQELGSLPGYDKVFMISGLRGSGVRHLKEYLLEESVLRPWEEEKGVVTDMSPIAVAKDVVWEHVLDNVHQEIPYHLHHKHVSWKILKDRSIRIEQQIIVPSESHKKIIIGKNGSLIRKIGIAANEELSARFGTKVHLILSVKTASSDNAYAAAENADDEMWL